MKTRHFIIIDNDPLNNFICKKTISLVVEPALFEVFLSVVQGLEYINTVFCKQDHSCILLLDLYMPGETGWDFLEEFSKLEKTIQKRIRIYVVTSSIDPEDKRKLAGLDMVRGLLFKPLRIEDVEYHFMEPV